MKQRKLSVRVGQSPLAELYHTQGLEAVNEGVIAHTYNYQDQENFYLCIMHDGKYYLKGLSREVVGETYGGQEDVEEFRQAIAHLHPRVYSRDTHRLFLAPLEATKEIK